MSATAPPPARRALSGVLLALSLVAVAAAAGFLLYRLTAPPPATLKVDLAAPSPRPPVEADALPAQDGAPVRRIPEDLPPIRLPDLDGQPHSLSDFRGKLLMVNFWATWCEPCRREIPLLQRLRRERAANGVEIVGIALDHRADVAQYVRTHDMRYPVLIGEQGGLEAANALGMDTILPFTVFADRGGHIVTLKIGELHPDEAALVLDRMTDLDQGRLTLAVARQEIASGMTRLSLARNAAPAAAQ